MKTAIPLFAAFASVVSFLPVSALEDPDETGEFRYEATEAGGDPPPFLEMFPERDTDATEENPSQELEYEVE